MTASLVRHRPPHPDTETRQSPRARARDWAEIQERMLVPLHEAVLERLDVGPDTRLLGLRCGSGLALLPAAARGAAVTGVDSCPELLALARERLLPADRDGAGARAELCARVPRASDNAPFDLVTLFEPVRRPADDREEPARLLAEALPLAARGAAVVLAGWGPPERCATSSVLAVAAKLADPLRRADGRRPGGRDDLEETARRAGLRPDGSGRVSCPFGYADPDSAVRGLLATGLFDAAARATDARQVDKELAEALHPYIRPDGTVRMPNVFRYLIARLP
ncbi:methyltransferase domain-containing protein [Streptomyces misionensis]|uniref:Methyltransferase domain-containing protein n=1 Tax=Streptomyces misionensis TaxID=67331 RepID=A0A5C6IMW4_9ACTN|nr:methyltransferase domain-containing protein [Streptomyces misionensis]TWV30430.1 methyltransferase domain-containing protein [Streptomyces misionensis]